MLELTATSGHLCVRRSEKPSSVCVAVLAEVTSPGVCLKPHDVAGAARNLEKRRRSCAAGSGVTCTAGSTIALAPSRRRREKSSPCSPGPTDFRSAGSRPHASS